MKIEIIYATTKSQDLVTIEIAANSTILDALLSSNVLAKYNLNLNKISVGVFGKIAQNINSYRLYDQDRIEIYRELICDSKAKRKALVVQYHKKKFKI